MSDTATQDWKAEARRLHGEGMSERKIAEAVGKAPSTVHLAVTDPDPAPPSQNGNGPHIVSAELAERIRQSAEAQGDSSGVIPGQTTVDDHLPPSEEPAPEDDPEHPETLAAFKAEAGEAVGPMPPRRREMDGGSTVYVEEIRIDGTSQTALDLGGKRATSASCSFTGKATVDGSLRKGDVITGTFTAVVRGAAVKDKVDKQTGIVTEAAESFSASFVDLVLD